MQKGAGQKGAGATRLSLKAKKKKQLQRRKPQERRKNMSENYSVYYGEGNSVYDQSPLVWSDDCHPYVTDDEWSRMKAGEEVTVDSGCFYGIIDDEEA